MGSPEEKTGKLHKHDHLEEEKETTCNSFGSSLKYSWAWSWRGQDLACWDLESIVLTLRVRGLG